MHIDHTTLETAERRKKKSEDLQKRAAYRKAHGLEKPQGFGGWLTKPDEESSASVTTVDQISPTALTPVESSESTNETSVPQEKDVYVDWEGKSRPIKKWLGIW